MVVLVPYTVGVRGRSALSAVSATVGGIKCHVLFGGRDAGVFHARIANSMRG